MCDLNVVYYTFKERYKTKLKEQYNVEVPPRLYYTDIVEFNTNYKNFIKKLVYLISEVSINTTDFYEINNLLASSELIDRLNGLKKSHDYVIIK